MKRALLLLALAVAPAGAQPDGAAAPAPLAASIAVQLGPVLAELQLNGAAASYHKIAMDSTLAAVARIVRPGKRDCDGVTAPSFCPKQLVHVQLGEASGWFVGGHLYRLERLVSLPSWSGDNRAEYRAAFDALVTARFPGGKVEHVDATYWQSRIDYDVGGDRPLGISLEMAAGGLATVRIDLAGKSLARADQLAALEDKLRQAAEQRRERAANRESCRCKLATIGSRWPVYNGHAMRGPDAGRWQVISVDPKHCTAEVKDTMMGGEDEWSCTRFVLPRVNPAGARDARRPALACGDILRE